jgi:stearoyl-CoA desaturase (Delta-9 desaturase)
LRLRAGTLHFPGLGGIQWIASPPVDRFFSQDIALNVLSSPRTQVARDGHDGSPDDSAAEPVVTPLERIVMFSGTTLPFVGLCLAIYLAWGKGVNALDITLMLGMYAFTILGISVGFHRQLTHRAFKTGPVIKFILAAGGSMAMQGTVIQWCAVHRRHHQESDREGDPHSPHNFGHSLTGMIRGMWHSHMGWLYEPDPPDLARSVGDLIDDPVIAFVDKMSWPLIFCGMLVPALIAGAITRTWEGAFFGFLWGGLVRVFLLHHTTFSINSICHIWGTRPFRNADQSRNNVIFGVLSFGEGWHNNHHAFPTSARHGLRWYQLDLGWWLIWALQKTGLAWDVRRPSISDINVKLRKAPVVAAPAEASAAN